MNKQGEWGMDHAWRKREIIRNLALKICGKGLPVRPILMSEDNITLGAPWEQLVEALRYKPEGRCFDSRWCHCNFYWHIPSGRNVALRKTEPPGSKGGRCLGLTILRPSCAEFIEIWEPQHLGIPWVCIKSVQWLIYLYLYTKHGTCI